MSRFFKLNILFFLLILGGFVFGQDDNFKIKQIPYSHDTIQFDSVSVFSSTFQVFLDSNEIPKQDYYLNPITAQLYFYFNVSEGQIWIRYNVSPINLNQTFSRKNDTLILPDDAQYTESYIYHVTQQSNQNLFGSNGLQKQGSISRGVTVGNAQNLSLQSTLNLQLNGRIAENLYLKGAISDNNIPFQPEGNTQKLQDFDQVYLQVYNDNFSVVGGDFWLKKPQGYFLNYNKRTQGLSLELNQQSSDSVRSFHKVSGAFSKGKFARNIVQGTEGNQGPYRLTGAENEPFIVVLAGTEKVYIDGELLTRGQEFDYIIDYNTSEITFTAKRLITKDKRIIVEFQYSDLNYARSLFSYNSEYVGDRYKVWANYYSEQDAKNQPIQQTLSDADKFSLLNAGDSLNFALSNSIDSVGYFDNRVLYALIDSMGYDSVLVFSVNPDSAFYQAVFQNVGQGNGDYVLDQYTANGKVYKWVEPIGGISQGDFAPVRLLVAPQRKQMFNVGANYQLSKNTSSFLELAYSNFNKNTFSKLDSEDDQGVAVISKTTSVFKLDSLKHNLIKTNINFEYNHKNFNQIQWFRAPEFDRDWNVRNKGYYGHLFLTSADASFVQSKNGTIGFKAENLIWGKDYIGWRNNLFSSIQKENFNFNLDGSWLLSEGVEKSDFFRHKIRLSKQIGKIKLGVEDIHERNKIIDNGSFFLSPISYQFFDVKAYLSSVDSTINKFELYYRQRHDWNADSLRLKHSAVAQEVGFSAQLVKHKNNQTKFNVNYRALEVLDSTLLNFKPENTILGRIEENFRILKNVISSNTFYEIGSGLELKKEFIFIQVPAGQGAYAWIDYNGDNVKDLGEFEIAQFSDQAEYIRVFIPTNEYVRTYSNQFSQTFFIKPEKVWRNKKGIKKFISRFSNQLVYKVNRKTSYEKGAEAFNPFVSEVLDTNLLSTSSVFRNTVYFNRVNSKFGVDYSFQSNASKILLSNGFDSRFHTFNKINLRWNITREHTIKSEYSFGQKSVISDYANNRDYNIDYYLIKPSYSFQPNSKMRLALIGKYSLKHNKSDLNELAIIRDVGIEFRFNQPKKGSFLMQSNFINISYNASNNTSIAYEMLEGLKTGNNVTISLSYQRKVGKNLQLNFNYGGRKSEGNQMIHTGGMELRAFF
ncbi:MAG: hypothetical protein ACWA41_11675 [Putridiphycobacter sp.]